MKIKICLLGIFAFVTLVVAEPRNWVLKTGETVTGDYVSSGTTTLVVKTGGTNCFLMISSLSIKDQAYTFKMQVAQRQARLDAEAKQMESAGGIEFTAKLIDNFPEKVDRKAGWMDAEYEDINNIWIESKESELGFQVNDKNGDSYQKCYIEKTLSVNPSDPYNYDTKPNSLIPIITNLKRGDRVRLVGTARPIIIPMRAGGPDQAPSIAGPEFDDVEHIFFNVERVEMIETAAEKNFIEQQDSTIP